MTTENKMPELKPCPFCGVTPTIEQIETTSMYSVVCGYGSTCKDSGLLIAISDRGKGIGPAIAAWNTRADIAENRIAELECELVTLKEKASKVVRQLMQANEDYVELFFGFTKTYDELLIGNNQHEPKETGEKITEQE